MGQAAVQVDELEKKITDLNKQSPIPSKDNYEKITADAKIIEIKTKEIQQIFGRPYKQAVDLMLKELGTTREEFLPIWKKTYEDETDKGSPRELIFNRFFAKFEKEKVEKALTAFTDKVREISVEPLNDANLDGCVMEALGLPRKMEPIPCKRYMMDMQDNLLTYMNQGQCQSCGELINIKDFDAENCSKCNKEPGRIEPFIFGSGSRTDTVNKLTFEKFDGASLPRPDEVSYIFKHFKLIEDLLFRIKASGIEKLDSISKDSLQGENVADYMVFTYMIQVTGPLNSIRNLMNNLLEAYRENRIYSIKSVSIEAKEDAKSIVSEEDTKKTPRRRRTGDKEEEEEEKKPDKAGVPIIGNNETVTAEIKLEYVIYIGDELTEND